LSVGFKTIAIALMIGTPLAGVWLASSLAAFANRATWLPVLAGVLLFPGLPLAWEGFSAWRQKLKKKQKRFLTFGDRLILRTLGVNVVFLVVLLAAFPSKAFVALSTRGDWMLDGHHGSTAESLRRGLLTCAGALEWLYRAANDNPYRDDDHASRDVDPTPAPTTTPTPTPAPTPKPVPTPTSSSVAPAPSTSATEAPQETPPPVANANAYPLPAKLHPAVVSMPKEAEATIEGVGRYIAAHEPDPMQRVKAIHDWVADRIAYDTPNYVAHQVPDTDRDPNVVFRTRVGVCAGYAKLLTAIGKVTGDEILYIVGDARSEEAPMEGESHAWNAAKINGSWYLIDATWDAGGGDGGVFKKHYTTDYLFTPPDQFVVSHFPDAAKWQLLERPLSRVEFFRRPVLAPAFFQHGLVLRAPDQSQVSTGRDLDLDIDNPRDVFLLFDYQPKGMDDAASRVTCTGDKHTKAHCTFQRAGTYDVRMYVNTKQYGNYDYAGSVEVNARP